MISFDNKTVIFKEPALQDRFNDQGFVVLEFLDAQEIEYINQLYNKLHPDGVAGFYTSTFAKDTDYRKIVDEEIKHLMKRGLEKYFFDYKVYCGSFIVKAPGQKSELILHQDMTLVDESRFTGTNIWIPLVNLDEKNGAIEILPKSHRLFKTYRGSSLPDIYDGIVPEVKTLLKPCYLKAGQAIIFDQSIIHYSPPNLSDRVRPVINTFITHKDASIKICYWDKKTLDAIEIFDQEEDFMVNFQNFGHDIFSRPSIGTSAGLVPYDFPKITPEILKVEYGWKEPLVAVEKPIQKRRNFFERLFSKNT